MPLFKILPVGETDPLAEFTAIDAGAVLNLVGRLDCREADVLQDGIYSFSARLSDSGMWSIFQRDGLGSQDIPLYG